MKHHLVFNKRKNFKYNKKYNSRPSIRVSHTAAQIGHLTGTALGIVMAYPIGGNYIVIPGRLFWWHTA